MNRRSLQTFPLALGAMLAGVLALAGCGKHATVEEHDEKSYTGPHGGALVELSSEALRATDIFVDSAGAREIAITIELPGEIKRNAERSVDVRPTYAGRVQALRAGLGTTVRRGQPLAVIFSNESLSDYVIPAPMTGTIVARPVSDGAVVDRESVLYTVADLSSVWLEFPIYLQHLGRIHSGQQVHIRTEGGPASSATGVISYVGPALDVDTRTTYARVVLPNRDGRWQPGRLVTAAVVLDRVRAAVTVPEDAIVRMGDGAAVFRADSSGFEVQPVVLGRSDGTTTEIVSGLERGARIVVRNAFWLKAELEKEAGGHED